MRIILVILVIIALFDRYRSHSHCIDSCLRRVEHYTNVCEEQLCQRKRYARDSQHHNERKDSFCCALYLFRDCLSRVIMDRCSDPNPIVVDILMGARKNDTNNKCRHRQRYQCSVERSVKQSFGLMFMFRVIGVVFC